MQYEQKQELIRRIEMDIGVHELFKMLDLQQVSRKNGGVYAVCPFHEGADNPTGFCYKGGFGYCFTHCHRKFDLFDITMKARGCEFTEAVAYLADLVGMEVDFSYTPKQTTDSQPNREFLNQLRSIKSKKKITQWTPIDLKVFNDFIPNMHTTLRQEGFDNDVKEYFGICFGVSGYMEDRVVVPIDYSDGSIITVSGRSIYSDEVLQERNIRRYQIWYDTDKGVTLYNISRALPYIELQKEVIVVEGFKSVWRLHQWGYRNVVAVMGNVLTEDQKKILLKLNCDIIVCGDKDKAGIDLNNQVVDECKLFADVKIMDMYLLDVPEKSSIDNITKEQFEYIYNNRK